MGSNLFHHLPKVIVWVVAMFYKRSNNQSVEAKSLFYWYLEEIFPFMVVTTLNFFSVSWMRKKNDVVDEESLKFWERE